ncbi:MAG: TIGR03915 family putative DNA repair protein [Epsilonproteobacteria bacterium]|nr:TIGR03915 family putative DNA repair protein [Campylobacterota bacterium]
MSTYLYDGSFEGFLSVVYYSYRYKVNVTKIIKNPKDIDLLDEVVEIQTNSARAQKVYMRIVQKFQKRYVEKILQVFLCDTRDFEKALYAYIVLGFRDQRVLENINHPTIYAIEKLVSEYFRHLHKMYGFIRFVELEDGLLYAKLEGKFNLLPYLGKHFVKRLDGYDFILHDTQRALAYVQNKEEGSIHMISDFEEPTYAPSEAKFQKLWKTFFRSVLVQERKNLKLQQSWVPLHYRKYMTEFR